MALCIFVMEGSPERQKVLTQLCKDHPELNLHFNADQWTQAPGRGVRTCDSLNFKSCRI
jgi:hypothetical protein